MLFRVLPFKFFSMALTGNTFSAVALFYIRYKLYFRFLSHKKFYQKHHK